MRKRNSSQKRCASNLYCGHLELDSMEETLADNEWPRSIPCVGETAPRGLISSTACLPAAGHSGLQLLQRKAVSKDL